MGIRLLDFTSIFIYNLKRDTYVAQGHSFNIRVCTGEAPESGHAHEVCHDYSGYAPLHGWSSPFFSSYNWVTYGCDGYADILNHVGIASHTGC